MSNPEIRTRQLQQIPVFALRQAVHDLVEAPGMEPVLRDRLQTVLKRRPRIMKRAIHRLTREQLTQLIDTCPEITDEEIGSLFEEYRYGTSPSFSIYFFDVAHTPPGAWKELRPRLEDALEKFSKPLEEGLQRIRRVRLNDLVSLPDQHEIMEGNYRFLARLDYVDEDEDVVSTYQTLYGFFWINTTEGYAIIQARSPDVLGGLQRAIEAAAGIALESRPISKYLKNKLPFLSPKSFRSGRLYDPDPDSERFRWLTIADDNAYQKKYDEWEGKYPFVRSVRYREIVGKDKETSLTIRCDQAAFGLAGRLKASEFRAWCLDRLSQLIAVLDAMRTNLPKPVETRGVADAIELSRFDPAQKEHVLNVISTLLTLQQAPHLGEMPVGASTLEIAAALGALVHVQVHFEHPTFDCAEEGDVACPVCGGTWFTLARLDGTWQLTCQSKTVPDWSGALPLRCLCEQGHEFQIEEEGLAGQIVVLPDMELLQVIKKVVSRHLPGHYFNPDGEGFILRGPNLVYYPDRKQIAGDVNNITNIYATQNIGTQTGGKATVINVGQFAARGEGARRPLMQSWDGRSELHQFGAITRESRGTRR